jgi:signal transduction histidine kinase
MTRSLRTKLLIGIAPLVALVIGLGAWAVVMFQRLGGNIDLILRENYASVRAAQNMKEALERMDSAFWFAIGGQEDRAREQFAQYRPIFEKNLEIEQKNVTLPGEQEMADDLTELFGRYVAQSEPYFALPSSDVDGRTRLYFQELFPTFDQIKTRADDVLTLNQGNMEAMDRQARAASDSSVRWMITALVGSVVLAALIAAYLSRSIVQPIRATTEAARAMARGNLEQVVPVDSRDELGELASTFNTMARRIREFQQSGTARLLRAQKTAQAAIDSLPDPVVVVDNAGAVERANPSARRLLGVTPTEGPAPPWHAPAGLDSQVAGVLSGDRDYLPTSLDHTLCLRDDGNERFYLPRVLAIKGEGDDRLGAALVLQDVTKLRLVDQLKTDMVSTVSHELKTPLTGLQMAVHLLLEEVAGPLTSKQIELLLSARQDADRLLAIVNDLLDMTSIEQGHLRLDLEPVAPADLVAEAIERFRGTAQDAGVALEPAVAFALPPALADRERIGHVFDNLIGNAIRHTARNGTVRVTADADGHHARFAISDTGEGIPAEHLPRLFERFFRVPGSRYQGAGLGLAISRDIVEAHGGNIAVESEPGHGTTFTFRLPRAVNGAASLPNGATA